MTALPIAQFPDIVPPQVQVTARYPGAGAEVVEQTVAQPIESQVVGVDKALYMKSTSGNDGSYTLTVSFAVGTDPDINTVNVQNRVSLALPQLPEEVSRQGVTVKKKSSAILQVLAVYSPDQRYDTLTHLQKPANPDAIWEIALVNGTYRVRVVAGDASNFDSVFRTNVEGVLTVNGTPTTSTRWIEGTSTVTVTDGRLTIRSASGASNNKICFVEITAQ